jgi:hypothetical protein
VPPPSNPPEMTFQEKQEPGCKRVSNPPLCHCGRPSKLPLPDLDLPDKFTPFFRCNQRTHVSIIALLDKFIVLDILIYRGLYWICCAGWMTPMWFSRGHIRSEVSLDVRRRRASIREWGEAMAMWWAL